MNNLYKRAAIYCINCRRVSRSRAPKTSKMCSDRLAHNLIEIGPRNVRGFGWIIAKNSLTGVCQESK